MTNLLETINIVVFDLGENLDQVFLIVSWRKKNDNDGIAVPAVMQAAANQKLPIQQEVSVVDIPRIFTITESAHRIHNPFTPEKFAALGRALRLEPGARLLDLGSGSGEMLCTWARDFGIIGTGIDMSLLFSGQAKLRADGALMRGRWGVSFL
jgi:2-polyprenyl-3-methyl-5-hydroxy-6-metoxy-1,4-benzoquinol methylase